MKVLILRPDHIGDMLLTTPLLTALKKSFPRWNVTVLCGSWSAPVLDNNPSVDRIIICDFPWLARGNQVSWSSFYKIIKGVKSERFDLLINLRKAAKEAFVSRYIACRERWGFDVEKSSWAHTRTIHYRTDCHIADLYGEFTPALGGKYEHCGLELHFSEEEYSEFSKKMPVLPEKYIVLAPGAGYPEKYWIPDRWAQTADEIISNCKLPIVFIGSAAERLLAESIIALMKNKPHNVLGMFTIRQTGIVIKRAQFIVSVDSAAVHVASAVRTPVIGLYGPTNPVHWGPYPNGCPNQVISKVTSFKLGRGSTNRSGGMDLIFVNDVIHAVENLSVVPQRGDLPENNIPK